MSYRPDLPKGRRPALVMALSEEILSLKKYFREEYDSMLAAQRQQLYELQKRARLIKGEKRQKAAEL